MMLMMTIVIMVWNDYACACFAYTHIYSGFEKREEKIRPDVNTKRNFLYSKSHILSYAPANLTQTKMDITSHKYS